MKLCRNKDLFSPDYHLYVGKGWVNDPCGCSIYKGEYHIFFQYHEEPTPLGPGKWYHMKSSNLMEWEELGICLRPEFLYEKNGCWTGSSFESEGKHFIIYSGNLDGRLPQQQPVIACSEDGIHYKKCVDRPVITSPSPDGHYEMRDPKVFIRGNEYFMLQGATRDGKGEVVGYSSKDGHHWDYKGIFFQSKKWMGNMYECPDFFSLEGKDFLVLSPMNWTGHKNILLCGKADFELFRFECEQMVDLDLGSDFYAAQSFPLKDGGIAIVGWLGNWGKPHPEDRLGWAGMLSCTRRVHYEKESRKIVFLPGDELEQMRIGKAVHWNTTVKNMPITHPALEGAHKDIVIKTQKNDDQEDVRLSITVISEDKVIIKVTLDFLRNLIQIDKTMAEEGDNGSTIISCDLLEKDKLRLLLDGSAFELFTGNGQVITERIYPSSLEMHTMLNCESGTLDCDIAGYDMGSFYN